MKKLYLALFSVAVVAVALFQYPHGGAKAASSLVSPNIVISQFQAGGGTADDEFVELHNIGSEPVDINGYKLVYRSATGVVDVGPFATWSSTTVIQPGQFYLVASTTFDGGIAPDMTYSPSACMCSMGANGGGLAMRLGAVNTGSIIDSVGWGTATNAFVETAVTSPPGNNNSQARNLNGCQDTDNNSIDFANVAPSTPRNSNTAPVVCDGGGANLFAAISATPSSVSPGDNSLLVVTVIPASTPPSTGITVVGDLTQIAGSATQQFYDDGTHGDVTAGDNKFSFLANVPLDSTVGTHTIFATAADGQGRSVSLQQNLTVIGTFPNEDPLIFGNPSGATADVANENNYLMVKPQYTMAYNRSKATTNWTAWRLDSSWIGSTPRQDDFRPDSTLPAGWYQVLDTDYSGSGYDRGHMCPSGDRTNSVPNNSATFLMTNMVPQLSANNQGPWEELESYCRTLAGQGKELYIISGPSGNIGTISGGRIVVPQVTWKVVLVLDNGADDVNRVTRNTRAFGVIIPNYPPLDINAPWRNFRVSVDKVEALTGYDFFSNIPKIKQEIVERRHDQQ